MNNPEKRIIAIVAMTANRVIGKDGGIPWHYSEDLKRFKRKTIDSTIIMGRKTWQSIGSKPLPNRRNIVISRNTIINVESYQTIEKALSDCIDQIWIIGGGEIYNASLQYCDVVDVTWVPENVEGEGLAIFPELDESSWQGGEILLNEYDNRLRHQLFSRQKLPAS